MKPLAAVVLLAAFGFAAAGCGATKKDATTAPTTPAIVSSKMTTGSIVVVPATITVDGRAATIQHVTTGTLVRCTGWQGQGVKVLRRGGAVAVGESTLVQAGRKSGPHPRSRCP